MKRIFCTFLIMVFFALTSCSEKPEDVTWGTVNKQFVELEKERSQTFEVLKEKPSKTSNESEGSFCFINLIQSSLF